MSAPSSQQPQHQSAGNTSNPSSRVGSGSPVDNKRILVKNEETRPSQSQQTSTESKPEQEPSKPQESQESNARPQSDAQAGTNTPDYFSLPRPNRLDQEPNPFEQSFAHPSATPGSNDPLATPKAVLPPVTAMTSPALGGPGGFQWGPNSLRSGPLSPAMLPGPTNPSLAAFDSHLRTGLTPNESGIRSGLTPGGTGSLFHAASPSSSQFLFSSTTPGTMEFQKTALSAAQKSSRPLIPPPITEVKSESDLNANRSETKPRQPSDPFAQDPAHNAANGLFLLAQMGGNGTPNNFQQGHMSGIQSNAPNNMDSSPNLAKRAAMNNATSAASRTASSSAAPNGVREISEVSNAHSDSSEEPEMPSSARKGRNTKGRTPTTTTGKRRNENGSDTKTTPAKKSKNSRAMSASDDGEMDDYDHEEGKKDGKKMTDEEKRKNFLERNRVAALKCRQRKKQWLANLQAKVEMYGTENDALNAQVQQLREEIVSLKTLLLAHKDCPVARANGVQLDMASLAAGTGDYNHIQMMPTYPGMMPNVMHQQPPGERRYS